MRSGFAKKKDFRGQNFHVISRMTRKATFDRSVAITEESPNGGIISGEGRGRRRLISQSDFGLGFVMRPMGTGQQVFTQG